MTHPNRREFAQTGAAGVLTALSAGRVLGANRRIRLGFIGLGNRGDQVLDAFLPHKDAEIVALCDLYQPYLDFAAKKVGGSPKITKHYHDVLAMKDVDAVVICTPDHWHALQTIHACQAGKDVYVEKPLSLRVEEGRHMVEAARKGKRITQVGLMRRSSVFCRDACEFVRKGGIGHVTVGAASIFRTSSPTASAIRPTNRTRRIGVGTTAAGRPPRFLTIAIAASIASAGSTTFPVAN